MQVKKDFVVSVSFRNYIREKTGMPKVMLSHQQMFNQEDISYVGIISVKQPILHDRALLFCKYSLIIDGEHIGVFEMHQLINMFVDWCKNGHRLLDIHIHHLLYTNLNRINDLLKTFYDVPVKAYLHDYYNACSNINLMKNGREFCGGKGLAEEHCASCPEYKCSVAVQKKIHQLYSRYLSRLTFVCPSNATRSIFLNFHPEYEDNTIVVPHQVYDTRYRENLEPLQTDETIRVAYLGLPVHHKGWQTWSKLAEQAGSQYEFIVFNSCQEQYPGMKKVDICFSADNLNAMADALRREKVHIALLWSRCPETYSYTCFEAYSANAFLITCPDSGNIADAVQSLQCGLVLESEEELLSLFADTSRLRGYINDYRATTPGGPLVLKENPQTVALSKEGGPDLQTDYRKLHRPVNYLLLAALNYITKRRG